MWELMLWTLAYAHLLTAHIRAQKEPSHMSYKVTVTPEMSDTLAWVGGRYGWADCFPCTEVGEHVVPEHEMWQWSEAVRADMEGGHNPFPCLDLDSPTGEYILHLWENII